jgi:hypothetical protein
MQVEDTGKLFMWSFLSRGVSPYTQESLFIDAFGGIDPWLKRASDGRWDPAATEAINIGGQEEVAAIEKRIYDADVAAYNASVREAERVGKTFSGAKPTPTTLTVNADGTVNMTWSQWAKNAAPKGSGQPGAGATHNLNAFGNTFLTKMSQRDADGQSLLQKLHALIADPSQTGPAIRRWFIQNTEGVGIDNKVVSFTLLVAGFPDVMVLDRVQIRQLWDDGRFGDRNLYDGENYTRLTLPDGRDVRINVLEGESDKDFKARVKAEVKAYADELSVDAKDIKNERIKIAGTALSDLTYGARGLLVYEAIERALAKRVENIYTMLGRPKDASIGRYHWETWVADSAQEASHGTLDAILSAAKGEGDAMSGVHAKEGEYGGYAYGARYGRDASGSYFLYTTPLGTELRFEVPAFREFLDKIKSPKNKVVPTGFKVTEAGNAPWYERPEVNKQVLDDLARKYGRETADGEGAGAVRASGPSQAVSDQPGRGTAGAGTFGPEYVVANNPSLMITAADGQIVPAARALANADAEIAKAEQDSQGYEAAVACAMRG